MKFLNHLRRLREGYLWVPMVLLLVWLCVHFIPRVEIPKGFDDPGALIGWSYNLAALVVGVIFIVGLVKPHLFDDIDTKLLMKEVLEAGKNINNDSSKFKSLVWFAIARTVIDSCETIFLFLLCTYVIFFR